MFVFQQSLPPYCFINQGLYSYVIGRVWQTQNAKTSYVISRPRHWLRSLLRNGRRLDPPSWILCWHSLEKSFPPLHGNLFGKRKLSTLRRFSSCSCYSPSARLHHQKRNRRNCQWRACSSSPHQSWQLERGSSSWQEVRCHSWPQRQV